MIAAPVGGLHAMSDATVVAFSDRPAHHSERRLADLPTVQAEMKAPSGAWT